MLPSRLKLLSSSIQGIYHIPSVKSFPTQTVAAKTATKRYLVNSLDIEPEFREGESSDCFLSNAILRVIYVILAISVVPF